ncbi:MAG: MGDG synthase family glycosyltransferase [Bacillota bacterium]
MKKLRVLVFSTIFGAGHIRAAEAIIQAITTKAPYSEFIHLDYGKYINSALNNIIRNTYIGMIKYYPQLWGKFYLSTANISPDSLIQRFLNSIGLTRLEKLINSLQPDLIICTYPTVAGVISQLKLKKIISIPHVTVVTDYVVHSQWIHPGVDLYIVGCREVFDGLVSRGIDPARIQVTGIPVSPAFERHLDRKKTTLKLGLCPDRRTILIMGGAYGVLEHIKEVCRVFAEMKSRIQLIVVCGHNKKLYKALCGMVGETRNPIYILGFESNVEELMTAADLIITKAGGLTVSEALTKRLPLVIYMPIPGQEEANAAFLRKNGAGRVAYTIKELKRIVNSLLEQPKELEKMRQAAAVAVPGRSAERAAEHILYLVKGLADNAKTG